MKAIRLTQIGLLVLVAAIAGRANADLGDWWCRQDWNWNAYSEIQVVIHPDLNTKVLFPDDSPWTDAEIRNEVEFMMERFMMQAPSGMPPLRFAGFEPAGTDPLSLPGAGRIAVRWVKPGNGCTGYAEGSVSSGVIITVSNNTIGCTTRRTPVWRWGNEDQREMFGGQLASELFHALGFDHWDEANSCTPPGTPPPACIDNGAGYDICGQMQNHGVVLEWYELERSDYDALVAVYGGWDNDGRYRRESSGGSTWTTVAAPTILSGPMWASSASLTSTLLPIIATDPASQDPSFYRWERSTGQIQSWGTSYSFGTQHGQIAAGYKPGMLFSFFATGQLPTDTTKLVAYSYAPSAGNWTTVTSTLVAHRQGVTGAYDPKSDKLILVYRGWDNQILLTSATPGGPISQSITEVLGAANRAAYTPSITCGDASLSYNCILVWPTAAAEGSGQRTHTMRWAQFTFNGTNFSFANIYGNTYTMFGPPSVVYKGPAGSTAAFVTSWHNPGNCYYTLQKAGTASSGFGVGATHCSGTNRFNGPPLLGAADYISQAWVQFNATN